MSGFDRMDLRAAPASTSGPVVSAFLHGGAPSISISIVKLSTVRMSTITPRTAASVSDGVDVTDLDDVGRDEQFKTEKNCTAE